MAHPVYRMYVDESGDHTFEKLDDGGHRYLALVGVVFRLQDTYPDFHDRLEALKEDIWGRRLDYPVVLHRTEIIERKSDFYILQDDDKRMRFDQGLLKVIQDSKYILLATVIDKRDHQKYPDPIHPYHYCMTALLERYCLWLNERGEMGDVLAEARGAREDRALGAAYAAFYRGGTRFVDADAVQRALSSKEVKLKKKDANVSGLQLADVIAQPVKQWVLWKKSLAPEPTGFGRSVAEAATAKFRTRGSRSDGYGWKWFGK